MLPEDAIAQGAERVAKGLRFAQSRLSVGLCHAPMKAWQTLENNSMKTNFISVDRMSDIDKAFLLETLLDFCAGYDMYMTGDNPDFISEKYHSEVIGETSRILDVIIDRITIESQKPSA